MMLLTAEQILALCKRGAASLPSEDVPCPELGGDVRIRALTGEELDEYRASMWEIDGKEFKRKRENITAKLVSFAAVGEKGERLFTVDQAETLGQLAAPVLARLCEAAERLSGLSAEAKDAATKN